MLHIERTLQNSQSVMHSIADVTRYYSCRSSTVFLLVFRDSSILPEHGVSMQTHRTNVQLRMQLVAGASVLCAFEQKPVTLLLYCSLVETKGVQPNAGFFCYNVYFAPCIQPETVPYSFIRSLHDQGRVPPVSSLPPPPRVFPLQRYSAMLHQQLRRTMVFGVGCAPTTDFTQRHLVGHQVPEVLPERCAAEAQEPS